MWKVLPQQLKVRTIDDQLSCVYIYTVLQKMFCLTIGSSPVRNIVSTSPDNSTLTIFWLAPASPNGVIVSYLVRVSLYSVGHELIVDNITTTTYSAHDLCKS